MKRARKQHDQPRQEDLKNPRQDVEPVPDTVEENSEDSFPASDAPSWTPVPPVGQPKKPAPEKKEGEEAA